MRFNIRARSLSPSLLPQGGGGLFAFGRLLGGPGHRAGVFFWAILAGMEPDDSRPFVLKWSRTFPGSEDDYTGRDPAHPVAFARVYLQPAHPDPSRRWYWTAAGTHQLSIGHEATVRAAARAAEEAFMKWRDAL